MATKINSEFRMVGIKHSKSSLGTSHRHLLTREVRGRGWGMKRGREGGRGRGIWGVTRCLRERSGTSRLKHKIC